MKTPSEITLEKIILPILCDRHRAHGERHADCDGVTSVCGRCGVTAERIAKAIDTLTKS